MPVAQMRQFPVEHAGQVPRLDHHIANAQIAVDHAGRDSRRQMGEQPGQTKRDDRPVATRSVKLRSQPGHPGCGIEVGQMIRPGGIERMNPRHR